MKEDIQRILKLVEEGKLSAEDAAELIEAFKANDEDEFEAKASTPPPKSDEPKAKRSHDPFAGFFETIDRMGRDVSRNVNWSDIADQVKKGAAKGAESLKAAVEKARKGEGNWSNWGVFGAQKVKQVDLPLQVPTGKTLRIENERGTVTVLGGHDVGTITFDATFRALTEEDVAVKAAQYVPIIEESDQAVIIRQPDMPEVSVDIVAKVAEGTPVEIRASSGHVTVDGTEQSCEIHLMAGTVELEGLDGLVEVQTMSADIVARDLAASTLKVDSKSGDVKLTNLEGGLHVRCASGNVIGRQLVASSCSIETASGDVDVDFSERLDGTINLRSVSGDVQVQITDNCDLRVALSTLRGSAKSDLELTDKEGNEQRLTGRLGDGKGHLDASTISGDVRLRHRDATAP